jgi:hypothetical protein
LEFAKKKKKNIFNHEKNHDDFLKTRMAKSNKIKFEFDLLGLITLEKFDLQRQILHLI